MIRWVLLLLCLTLTGCSTPTSSVRLPKTDKQLSPLAQEVCRRAAKIQDWKEAKSTSGSDGLGWYVSSHFTDGKVDVWQCQERWNTGYGFSVGDKSLFFLLDTEEDAYMREVAKALFLRLDKDRSERLRKIADEKRRKEADEVLSALTRRLP